MRRRCLRCNPAAERIGPKTKHWEGSRAVFGSAEHFLAAITDLGALLDLERYRIE
jgi:hypothetical protein